MKVIILNSGIGRRMRPFTKNNPKCLAALNGKTILGNQIEIFMHYGLDEFIITTGPFGYKIKRFISANFPEAKVAYVKNSRYKSTNYIYSLFLAKGLLDDDVILLHGDMVFEKQLIGRLLGSRMANCVLVNKSVRAPEKDFKAEIKNNLVRKISVDIKGKGAFFLAPVYKFSRKDFAVWMGKIKEFVKKGKTAVYAEEALNEVSSGIKLHPVYFKDELCMEIDNPHDLGIARKNFA